MRGTGCNFDLKFTLEIACTMDFEQRAGAFCRDGGIIPGGGNSVYLGIEQFSAGCDFTFSPARGRLAMSGDILDCPNLGMRMACPWHVMGVLNTLAAHNNPPTQNS